MFQTITGFPSNVYHIVNTYLTNNTTHQSPLEIVMAVTSREMKIDHGGI